MAKREYGTGSFYQRKDGIWVGTVEAGYTARGTRRRITVSSKDQAECKRKLRDKVRQVERDGLPATGARVTVKKWAGEWLEITKTQLRPKPWATDKSAVNQWIVPTIGHRRLDELTPADVRAVAQAQRAKGRSSSTALRTHVTLTAMLRAAMLEGYPIPARVLLVEAPAVAANDRDAMDTSEALAVLEVAGSLPHGSRWLTQILHGTRQAETLGLTWPAVDFDDDLIHFEWQLQPLPYIDAKNKALGFQMPDGYEVRHLVDAYHLTRPKTKAGQRVAPLLPALKVALLAWREIAPENPWRLVWPTALGRPANAKHDLTEWKAIQCTAGVGHPGGRWWYTHEARHGLATALMEHGEDEVVIKSLMGHSAMVSSRGYMHVKQAAAREALAKVAARLELG